MSDPGASRGRRLLDWRSGGWLLGLTVLLVLLVVAWRLTAMLGSSSRAVGDGRRVSSYGFDLSHLHVPRERLTAAGIPKDGIPALVDPPVMRGDTVAAFNEARRGKYLVSDDRVVGVVVGAEARAYPLRMLNWHEVVNDTLGGRPIAVTYHPLCDSVVVVDRSVAGETLELRVSGLLYNSNQLLYDKRTDGRPESLWSQLLARAIAGPAAGDGAALDVLPASLSRWDRWLERHPDTTVLAPNPDLLKRYERDPYGNYFLTGRLRFPVEPLPPQGSLPLMAHMLIVGGDGGWSACAPEGGAGHRSGCELLAAAGITIDGGERPTSVLVEPGRRDPVIYALWFAWYAHRADLEDPAARSAVGLEPVE